MDYNLNLKFKIRIILVIIYVIGYYVKYDLC